MLFESFAAFSAKVNARRIRRSRFLSFLRANSCSQIRSTRHPRERSVSVTRLSRALFASNLLFQNRRLLAGRLECFGQPCQKQPSTKTANLILENTKSGFPNTGQFRRHPDILYARKSLDKAISVSLLPLPRIRDMTSDRLALVKTSLILCTISRICSRAVISPKWLHLLNGRQG